MREKIDSGLVPAFDSAEAADITRAVEVVAEAVCKASWDGAYGLTRGRAGAAVFLAEVAARLDDAALAARADELLAQAFQCFSLDKAPPLSLFAGLAGLGWATQHLQRLAGTDEDLEDLLAIDGLLLKAFQDHDADLSFDLGRGATGVGLYALSRCQQSAAATSLLEAVLQWLGGTRVRMPAGIGWFTPSARLAPYIAADSPGGIWDLGVAHGQAGVCSFLASAVMAGRSDAEEMLSDVIEIFLHLHSRGADRAAFPAMLSDECSRLGRPRGWCYGDLGIACSLWLAGCALGRRDVEEMAMSICERAAQHEAVQDLGGGLCHGLAGDCLMFTLMARRTGLPLLAEAARGSALSLGTRVPAVWTDDSLMTGRLGAALTLLSLVTPKVPTWSEFLLL